MDYPLVDDVRKPAGPDSDGLSALSKGGNLGAPEVDQCFGRLLR